MNKARYKVSVDSDADTRFQRIADRFGMTAPALAAILIHEFSHVRPESFFEAIGAIPGDLKARPAGRPPGATSARSGEKTPLQAAS